MARLPRLTLPGHPHHLIQRAAGGQPVFLAAPDFEAMHAALVEEARLHGVAVHAYVLLPTAMHLLATPGTAESLGRLMQGVGRRYARFLNARSGRSGALWEGRYRGAALQAQAYLLDAMSLLDRLPVRAGLAPSPAEWPWSSHGHYVGQRSDRLVSPHSLWWQLGNTPFAREMAYAQRVEAGLPAQKEQALLDSALYGWVLGDEAFLQALQARSPRPLVRGQPGRPRTTVG
ncbi:transposase [Ramlibacter rhizophilus]|uniref:Transposase n=1 Tax=Ramlibacter rhizophilus TaxID=1781167 RepID=A0A4Z0BLI6_9BURK|nr:transposase [Ramlibacter rhizophilus]TFY99611.1 transposase [Ramlibacter rhizophilus]